MRIERLGWLGTRTENVADTAKFFREVMGLESIHEDDNFAMLRLPSGDRDFVEVFGPGDEATDFEAKYYRTGPVAGFKVTDLAAARSALSGAGIELLDEITWATSLPGYGWFHFRGPDGNVYGVVQSEDPPAAG